MQQPLDVLGVEDRGEDDQLHKSTVTLTRRYSEKRRQKIWSEHAMDPWEWATNEQLSRKRLVGIERKLSQNQELKEKYEEVSLRRHRINKRETVRFICHTSQSLEKIQRTTTTKVMNSINERMYTRPPLQPLWWDIMVRALTCVQ